MGFSRDSIARVWKAFGLKPHRHEHFQFSADSEFDDKVRDVVGLYMSLPANALIHAGGRTNCDLRQKP
jgi:hypothetical protein